MSESRRAFLRDSTAAGAALMVRQQPVFKHCHDVCIDGDENVYVCQWNADKTYPIKLHRA